MPWRPELKHAILLGMLPCTVLLTLQVFGVLAYHTINIWIEFDNPKFSSFEDSRLFMTNNLHCGDLVMAACAWIACATCLLKHYLSINPDWNCAVHAVKSCAVEYWVIWQLRYSFRAYCVTVPAARALELSVTYLPHPQTPITITIMVL